MYPGANAALHPDKPAYIMASTGETVTCRELDERSSRLAHFLRDRGLVPGDSIAVFLENHPRFLEIVWAAQRSGLFYTPVSSHLTAEEVAYIVNDCGAKALFTSVALGHVACDVPALTPNVSLYLACAEALGSGAGNRGPANREVGPGASGDTGQMSHAGVEGFDGYEDAVAPYPSTPIRDETEGADVLYSSGTTGRPKGVRLPRSERAIGTPDAVVMLLKLLYGMTDKSVYLSPAPLYHAAPLRFTLACTRLAATVVVMERFDPAEYLALVERHGVTHTQVVPTMFVRMLKMDEEERKRHDVSTIRCAIHASAPCPVDVKRSMIDWWGPVLYEYYAGTESNGFVACDSKEWLAHPGTVGRSMLGALHILDEEGGEVPTGEDGTVWFETEGPSFEYLNDPERTSSSRNDKGWTTLGDVGHVDRDGYLFLTDRKAYMIISGGVNIYPQEAENVLVSHPKVMDAAVFGIPDDEMGEAVHAVVELVDPASASGDEDRRALQAELLSHCRDQLAHYKCPRSIDFVDALPRHANGKLYKRVLRDRYWTGHQSRIV